MTGTSTNMEFTMESWVNQIVALEKGGDDEEFQDWVEKMFQLSKLTAKRDPPNKISTRLNIALLYMSRDDCVSSGNKSDLSHC